MKTTDLTAYANDKRQRVVADQEPISRRVSLYEAMARALKYNLDKRVREMDIILRDRSRQRRTANTALSTASRFKNASR